MRSKSLFAAKVAIGAAISMGVNADVIFNNLGSGNVAQKGGWIEVNAGAVPTVEFWSYTEYRVTEIDVSLVNVGGTNSATISLLSSTTGGAPGVVLGTWNVSGQPSSNYDGPRLTNITNICGVHLAAGKRYFLRIAPADATTQDLWAINQRQAPATLYFGDTLSAYQEGAPAFDVIGKAVLPGTVASELCPNA
jgi:hypothetical protein